MKTDDNTGGADPFAIAFSQLELTRMSPRDNMLGIEKRTGLLEEGLRVVQGMKVGDVRTIPFSGNLVGRLRDRTGWSLIAVETNKATGKSKVKRLPDGTRIYRGMKGSQFL